jgi:tryptophan synthase alpha chain
MNRILETIERKKSQNEIGIMTHVMVGFPSCEATESLVLSMADAGADFVELQIPFSDPIADGPVLLKAAQESLDRGTRVKDAFLVAQNIRAKRPNLALLFMSYANILLSYGIEKFIHDMLEIGVDGIIIPDLPFDALEGQLLLASAKEKGIIVLPVVAPSSSENRLSFLSACSPELVYAMSRTGVTGAKTDFSDVLDGFLALLRKYFSGSIALGFGIEKKEQIVSLQGKVDIAIIGTALFRIFEEEGEAGVVQFLQNIRS